MGVYEGFAELEKHGWSGSGVADGYINLFSPASDIAIPALIADLEPGQRVLDLCCGHGNVTEALVNSGADVVGADFSTAMLEYARRRVPGGEFIEADAQDLPFEKNSFDAVVSNLGIIHVPDQPKALSEVRRVLRDGGQFAMTSWCGPDVSPAFQVFYGCVQKHGHPDVAVPEGPNFHQFANEEITRSLFSDAGLELKSLEQIDCYWELPKPDHLAEIFEKGAPRGGYLLTSQPEENRNAIKTAVTRMVAERFEQDGVWYVPIPAALAKARAV
jgi:SAM-dependent methyltransferase